MRWTRQRRRADEVAGRAFGFVSDFTACRRTALIRLREGFDGTVPGPSSSFFERRARTAKSCGPDAPTLASSFAEGDARPNRAKLAASLQSDGGKKARSPGRARNKPLKPLRRKCRVFR